MVVCILNHFQGSGNGFLYVTYVAYPDHSFSLIYWCLSFGCKVQIQPLSCRITDNLVRLLKPETLWETVFKTVNLCKKDYPNTCIHFLYALRSSDN